MPTEIVTIYLDRDRARDLKLLFLAGNYHVAPKSDAQLADRLEYEVATEIIKQMERQGVR